MGRVWKLLSGDCWVSGCTAPVQLYSLSWNNVILSSPPPASLASASAPPLHMFWPDLEMSGQASMKWLFKWMELWSPPLWLPAHPPVEVLISRDLAQDGELGARGWGSLLCPSAPWSGDPSHVPVLSFPFPPP